MNGKDLRFGDGEKAAFKLGVAFGRGSCKRRGNQEGGGRGKQVG